MLPGLYCAVLFGGLLAVGFGSGDGDEVGTNLCRLPDGNFPNPDDCASFVRCKSGVSDTEPCPQGLLFNPFTFTCDFSKTGNCSSSEDFDSTSAPLPTTDIECPEDGPNIYSIVSSCSEYYLCDNGVAFRMTCPPALEMNPDTLTCDYEENVECDVISSTEERSVGITAFYENNNEDSEAIKEERLIISETSVNPNTDLSVAQTTETQKPTVENDFSEPVQNISTRSESISESATTSEISDSRTTEEIDTSTKIKYGTSETATEYTANKQPTVVIESTAQTKEVVSDFTEATFEPVKLISEDETEMSDYFTERTVETVPGNNTEKTVISTKTSSDIEITDLFTEILPDFTTSTENTALDQFTTRNELIVTALNISSTSTEPSYDSKEPEISQGTTIENDNEDESTVTTTIDEVTSVTADTETDTEGISSDVEKHSTTVDSFTTENDGNDLTTMEVANTSELNTSIDNTTNVLTTTQNILTNISTEITPEKSKSTTITLMSSDPSTDNETIEFSTTSEYMSTDSSILHTVENTVNTQSTDFEGSRDIVTVTRVTDFEPVTEFETKEMSTKLTTEISNEDTEYVYETTDGLKQITDAETIVTSDLQPISNDVETTRFSTTEGFLSTSSNSDDGLTTTFDPLSTIHNTDATSKSSTEDTTLQYSSNDYGSTPVTTLPTNNDATSVSIANITGITFEETKDYSETHADEEITIMPVTSTTEQNVYETTFKTLIPSEIMDLKSTSMPTTLETSTYETLSIVTESTDENTLTSTNTPVSLVTTDKALISTEYETIGSSLTDLTPVTNFTDYDISTTVSKLNTETASNITTKTTSALSNETFYSTDSDSSKLNTFDFTVSTESSTEISVSSDDLATENLTPNYTEKITSLSTSQSTETSEANFESTIQLSTNSEIQPDEKPTLSTSNFSLITDSDTFETQTILPTTIIVDTITPELITTYTSTMKEQYTSQNTDYESTFVPTESSTLLNTESSSEYQERTTEQNITNFTLVNNQTDLETLETRTSSTQSKETTSEMVRSTTKLPDETLTDSSHTVASESDYATSTIDQTESSKALTEISSISPLDETTTANSTTEEFEIVSTTSVSDFKPTSESIISFSTTDSTFNKDTDVITSQTSDLKYTTDKTSDLIRSTSPVDITVETDSENSIYTTETSHISSDFPSEETSSESDYATSTIDQTRSSKAFTETSSMTSLDEATTTDSTTEKYETVSTTSVSDFNPSSESIISFSTTDSTFNKDTDSISSQTTDLKYTTDKTSDLIGSTSTLDTTVETDSEKGLFTTETFLSSSDISNEETTSESDYATSTVDQNQSSKAFTETSSIPSLDEETTTDFTTEKYVTVSTASVSDFNPSSERTISFSITTDSNFNKNTDSSTSQTDLNYTTDKTSNLIGSTTPIDTTHETHSENLIFTTETSLSSSDLPTEETSSENNNPNETLPPSEISSYHTTDLETSGGSVITENLTLSTSTKSNEDVESTSVSSGTDVTDYFVSTVSEISTFDINDGTSSTISEKTDSDSSIPDKTESVTFKPTNEDLSTITDFTGTEDITTHLSSPGFTSGYYTEIETDRTRSDYSTAEHQTVTLPSETTTVNSICLTAYGFYPNPDDCHSFYDCSEGIPKLSLCTEDNHFNPVTSMCEDPCIAKCDPNANCPTTESEEVSTQSVISSTNPHFTETGESSLYTIITSEIQTGSTKSDDLISASDITTEVSTEPVSSSDFISVSETPISTDQTITTSVTDQNKSESTTDLVSVFTNTATSKSSEAISTSTYTSEDHSESASYTYLSSTFTETKRPSTIPNGNETEPYRSTEGTLITDGLSSISTNELQTDITEKPSSIIDNSESDEVTNGTGLFTTEEFDYSSDTDESIDTSLQTTSTSVTSSKCGNEGCSSTNVPVFSTPIPYRVCHLNDFLPRPNCNEYVDCTERHPKKKECPLGLYFNPTTRVCDWPFSAGCGGTGRPLYEPDESFECPCKSCLIPSSKSCAHYYLCLGYTAYHLQCSNSLLFDKSLNTCNYSPLVNCLEPSSTTVATRKPTVPSTTRRTTRRTTTTSTTTTNQPERFVCPRREGLFRYPGNCGMFYQCSNWYPYAMHCAAGTHFSEITGNCDYPCNAKCDLTLNCGGTAAPATTAAPRDPRCTCRNCKLPSDETCTKYIVCVNGRGRLENCPWGQTYDAKRATCDWAHRVDCRRSEICPERNGMFVHKDDCHKFVHCSNGIPYVKNCPANLEFDQIKQRCEWPAGRCSQSSIPKELEIFKTEEQREGWRCPKSFGYFSDDHHCNKFYHCSYGTPSLKECSEGLLYNPRYQNCDWKKHVQCQSNRHSSPKKCRVYDKHATCSSDRKPLPHHLCNMYYDCTAGRACAKQCPVGLYFNRTSGICDLPSNVICFHPEKNDYSLRDFSRRCSLHDHGHMSSPTDAACFYRCRQGKVIPGCCSRGHVYNQHRDRCERITKSYRL